METRYTEKRGITHKFTYEFVGYTRNAEPAYAEYETTFSIARGVIKDREFTRFVKQDGTEPEFIVNCGNYV